MTCTFTCKFWSLQRECTLERNAKLMNPKEQQHLQFSVSIILEDHRHVFRFYPFKFMSNAHRFDSVVNTYLIEECGLQPSTSSQYGLVVHSHADFFGSIAFPAVAELALRVNKLGKSSVTYEIGLFQRGIEEVKSVGELIHVFVDRETGRPAVNGMNSSLKEGLQKIIETKSKL